MDAPGAAADSQDNSRGRDVVQRAAGNHGGCRHDSEHLLLWHV